MKRPQLFCNAEQHVSTALHIPRIGLSQSSSSRMQASWQPSKSSFKQKTESQDAEQRLVHLSFLSSPSACAGYACNHASANEIRSAPETPNDGFQLCKMQCKHIQRSMQRDHVILSFIQITSSTARHYGGVWDCIIRHG
jgi:hypothetical protein